MVTSMIIINNQYNTSTTPTPTTTDNPNDNNSNDDKGLKPGIFFFVFYYSTNNYLVDRHYRDASLMHCQRLPQLPVDGRDRKKREGLDKGEIRQRGPYNGTSFCRMCPRLETRLEPQVFFSFLFSFFKFY
jgi:hypothetical protein